MSGNKKEIASLIENAIDRGTDTAEQIHRSVSDFSTSVLEGVGFGDKSSQELRQIQESSIGAIYNLVRDINHSVSDLARDIVEKIDTVEEEKKQKEYPDI